LEIGKKLGKFRLTYQLYSSSADCDKELFKPSKHLASLQVRNEKKRLVLGLGFVVSDVVSKVGFWPFWLLVPDLGPAARRKYFAEVFIGN